MSQSLDADENPIMSMSELLMLINQCDIAIEAAQDDVSNAYRAFDQYGVLGIDQCTPVINAIIQMDEPVQKLYDKLKETAPLFQRELLTELYLFQKQAEKLKSSMNAFRRRVVTASPQEIIRPRQTIRKQLISFLQQLSIISSLLIDEAYNLTANYQDNDWLTSGNTHKRNQTETQRYKETKVEMLRRIQMRLELNLLSVINDQTQKYIDPRSVPIDSEKTASLIRERIKEVELQLIELGKILET